MSAIVKCMHIYNNNVAWEMTKMSNKYSQVYKLYCSNKWISVLTLNQIYREKKRKYFTCYLSKAHPDDCTSSFMM